jgi:hypothetical protein
MLSSRSLSQKIGCQGQKDVTGRIVPTDFQKFLKMTTGCYTLASEPEPMKTPIKSIFSNTSNSVLQHSIKSPVCPNNPTTTEATQLDHFEQIHRGRT